MKHTNDITTPKNHTHATVVVISMVTIKAYIYKWCETQAFIDFIVLVVIPQIPSLIFFRFLWCKKKWLIDCTAILWFCFLYRISLVLLFSSSFPSHNPLSSSNFCDTRISISSITLLSLDCSSCIFLCNSTRRFETKNRGNLGGNNCSLMKLCLLSGITITATLTFPWFFWSKFKTLRWGD